MREMHRRCIPHRRDAYYVWHVLRRVRKGQHGWEKTEQVTKGGGEKSSRVDGNNSKAITPGGNGEWAGTDGARDGAAAGLAEAMALATRLLAGSSAAGR